MLSNHLIKTIIIILCFVATNCIAQSNIKISEKTSVYFKKLIDAKEPKVHKVFLNIGLDKPPIAQVDIQTFLRKNTKYPKKAIINETEGKVLVLFIVDKNGIIKYATCLNKPFGDGLEKEAMRVIKSLPPSIPGRKNGKPSSYCYVIPINFKLNK